jgi:hypothetical protein
MNILALAFSLALSYALLYACNNNTQEAAAKSDTAASAAPGFPAPVFSWKIPADVAIPNGFPGNPIAFFDDYSWQTFLALAWPALNQHRGEPDTSQTLFATGPRVFETYKMLNEVFPKDTSGIPAPWNEYDTANPCGQKLSFGQVSLADYSKFGDLAQAGFFGAQLGPLPAQNKTYTRFLTSFNKTEFDKIVDEKLYLNSFLPRETSTDTVNFPNGSIDIKTAWIDMEGVAHPERYYTDTALVLDAETGQCARKKVGLVGIHIVQKTASRPQWIWSSFEQVDNIPQDGAQSPLAFHDNGNTAMPARNPIRFPPAFPVPAIFNVDRQKPVASSTQTTNGLYQKAIRDRNPQSVWQFYQLVMTQWPLQLDANPIPASQSGTDAFTFPGSIDTTSSFANLTMETFEQRVNTVVGFGCMNCHDATKQTDFIWSLRDHAAPSRFITQRLHGARLVAPVPPPPPGKALTRLRNILEGAVPHGVVPHGAVPPKK